MAIRQPPSSINDPNLRGFLQELRNAIGKTGDQVAKVAMRVQQITNTPVTPEPPVTPQPPQPPVILGDGFPPPAPISLTSTPDAWAIRLTWEQPASMPDDYDVTEIWCRNATSGDKLLAGSLRGNSFVFTGLDSHLLSNAETWYFWVRNKDVENLTSAFYPNDDAGVSGQALPSPEQYIGSLIGDITSGTLWDYLTHKIALLKGPDTMPNSVNQRLATQYNDLVQRISQVTVSGSGTFDTAQVWYFDTSLENWSVYPAPPAGSSFSNLQQGAAYFQGVVAGESFRSPALSPAISMAAFPVIRARMYCSRWDGTIRLTNSANPPATFTFTPTTAPPTGTTFADYDWDLSAEYGTFNASAITRIEFVASEANSVIVIDWIAIGRLAPGASYSQVEAIRVRSDKKNRAFFQATAPTDPYTDGYSLVPYDLWFDTGAGNKPYRWNPPTGYTSPVPPATPISTHWTETTDTRLAESWAEIYDIRTATANPTGAAAQRINGIAANATSALTTGAANTAAIQNEATARASADAALSQQINQISAGVTYASRVFIQSTTPVSDSNYTLKANDLWYDTSVANTVTLKYWTGSAWAVRRADTKVFYVAYASRPTTGLLVGDLLYDTANNNAPYIWNGTIWVSALEGYINTLADAKITTFEQTKVGYATVTSGFTYGGVTYAAGNLFDNSGAIWTKAHVDAWNTANPTLLLTWNAKLPIAQAIKQVRVSDGTDSLTIEQQFLAKKDIDNKLLAQYTVKIDQGGWVSGFGIASQQQADGTVYSDFGVRADRFWLASPTSPLSNANGVGVNLVILDTVTGLVGKSVTAKRADGSLFTMGYFRAESTLTTAIGDWIHIKDARQINRTALNAGWNQSFKIYNKGAFNYIDGNGVSVSSANLPGLGFATTNLIAFDFGTSSSILDAYTAQSTATPPDNYRTKVVDSSVIPFIVTTTPRTIDNVLVPAGVYITDAYIRSATITNAKIADAAVTIQKMSGPIYSDDFVSSGGDPTKPVAVPGTLGWCITRTGDAVFNTVIARTKNIEAGAVTSSGGYGNSGNVALAFTDPDLLIWAPPTTSGLQRGIALNARVSIQSTQFISGYLLLYRNGSLLHYQYFKSPAVTSGQEISVPFMYYDTTAGANTYTLYIGNYANNTTIYLTRIDEYFLELKR